MGIATLLFAPVMVSAQEEEETTVCDHSTGKTDDTFLGYARFILTPIFVCDDAAISILGEAGPRNYRINGTWGTICDNSRFKIGGEYLTQNINYNFPDGHHKHWRQQFAFGAKYQYYLDCPEWCVQGVQVTGYYSHSHSHGLPDYVCNSGRITGPISRGVAGAWALGADVGVIIEPWCCAQLIASVGYDNVNYKRHQEGRKRVSGVGGALCFEQGLFWNLRAHIDAYFKRAYNALEAKLSWTRCLSCGELEIGIFGGHVWGKSRLPSTSNAGVELGFAFGVDSCCQFVGIECNCDCCGEGNYLARWVRDPAVYMPQVLAISEFGYENQ